MGGGEDLHMKSGGKLVLVQAKIMRLLKSAVKKFVSQEG